MEQQIREHMEVLGADGQHVGVVDRVEGEESIKLTKNDPKSDGMHHYIPMEWVDHVDAHVHLTKTSHEARARVEARPDVTTGLAEGRSDPRLT